MENIRIVNYCNKYNIKRYTDLGKPLTHNKLKNIINDHANKKHNLTHNQKYIIVLNNILKMILISRF